MYEFAFLAMALCGSSAAQEATESPRLRTAAEVPKWTTAHADTMGRVYDLLPKKRSKEDKSPTPEQWLQILDEYARSYHESYAAFESVLNQCWEQEIRFHTCEGIPVQKHLSENDKRTLVTMLVIRSFDLSKQCYDAPQRAALVAEAKYRAIVLNLIDGAMLRTPKGVVAVVRPLLDDLRQQILRTKSNIFDGGLSVQERAIQISLPRVPAHLQGIVERYSPTRPFDVFALVSCLTTKATDND